MNHEMRMPLRKAKEGYSKLLKKMNPYKGFMNKGLIEPGTNQDMGEYEEQMGSDASYMKMDPMHNGEPGVQQEDFEQFKKTFDYTQSKKDIKKKYGGNFTRHI